MDRAGKTNQIPIKRQKVAKYTHMSLYIYRSRPW